MSFVTNKSIWAVDSLSNINPPLMSELSAGLCYVSLMMESISLLVMSEYVTNFLKFELTTALELFSLTRTCNNESESVPARVIV